MWSLDDLRSVHLAKQRGLFLEKEDGPCTDEQLIRVVFGNLNGMFRHAHVFKPHKVGLYNSSRLDRVRVAIEPVLKEMLQTTHFVAIMGGITEFRLFPFQVATGWIRRLFFYDALHDIFNSVIAGRDCYELESVVTVHDEFSGVLPDIGVVYNCTNPTTRCVRLLRKAGLLDPSSPAFIGRLLEKIAPVNP